MHLRRTPLVLLVTALLAQPFVGASATPSAVLAEPAASASAAAETVIAVVGDIADTCLASSSSCVHAKTAKLVSDMNPAAVLTAGDNQYQSGTLAQYQKYYDTLWGKFKAITKPTPGNHEYADSAKGYKAYFGAAATPQGKPYYSFDVGDFHFVALDSDPITDGIKDEQLAWLKAGLAKNTKRCVGGYWHHPRFNSGKYGDNKTVAPLWDEFVKARADVVFGGHDHHYERIKPLNSQGKVDEANNGVRSAIVGIGGDSLYDQIKPREGVEKSFAKHGVMKLTLTGASYSWEIIGTDNKVLDKAGPFTCR